uniref:RNase H type-1 domain-containing protein n=1 Tax=Fagus sylvatica TaxID=28930 RepID=A0A2N9IZ43_FAGSY
MVQSPVNSLQENATVDSLILQPARQWNFPLIDQLFEAFEAATIKTIPLSSRSSNDVLIWAATQNGKYSVKTEKCLSPSHGSQNGFRNLANPPMIDNHDFSGKAALGDLCSTIGDVTQLFASTILKSLWLASYMRLQRVLVEGDCKDLMDDLNSSTPCLSPYGTLVEELKQFVPIFSSI